MFSATATMIVEVDGAMGGLQLSTELGNLDGEEGWRLGMLRLVEQNQVSVIQVACVRVVSKGRAREGKVFRMWALAVGQELRCQEGS